MVVAVWVRPFKELAVLPPGLIPDGGHVLALPVFFLELRARIVAGIHLSPSSVMVDCFPWYDSVSPVMASCLAYPELLTSSENIQVN